MTYMDINISLYPDCAVFAMNPRPARPSGQHSTIRLTLAEHALIVNHMVELEAPELTPIFHALGDATRRRMLRELAGGERTVGQLAQPFAISLAAASKHIKALEGAGLIRREVRGRTHICRLDPGPLASAHEWLSFYERFWTGRLDLLERLLREEDARQSPTPKAHAVLPEPATLTIQRFLPGPIERVWSYLTESDLRRQWLAAGQMEMKVDAPFELVWRNSELTNPPGKRPEGFGDEHRMESRITELDQPRRLAFTWGKGSGDVSFELEPRGERVLLTVIHRRLPDRGMKLGVSAGWHAHLDLLAARLTGREPEPFWDGWSRLKTEYDRRIPN